jgi:hypothetical protein
MSNTAANRIKIHDFHTDAPDYIAESPDDCRDEVDRMAYELALEHNDAVRIGSVLAEPEWV